MSYATPCFISALLLKMPSSGHLLSYWRKKPKEQPSNDAPEELDGYQLERSVAGDQELPTITYSTVKIRQPSQNQEEEM